jgi:ornithine cyclodeaminase/alanine dehydrogenase-like protein (mu-crystallin family)
MALPGSEKCSRISSAVDVRILRQPEIGDLLSYPDAIAAVEKCFADYSSGKAVVPDVINLEIDSHQGEVHVKAAHLQGADTYVIKIASGFYDNAGLGLPVGNGMLLLFEARTGLLRSLVFDHGYLTELRTAAAGAVAAKFLAKDKLRKVGLIGSGSQARFQIRALFEVRTPDCVEVWSRNPKNVRKYIDDMASEFPRVNFRAAVSAEAAVTASDLVITVTPSRSPLVKAEWLAPGMQITAVGSDGPEKQELEAAVLGKADLIFCDSRTQCTRLGEVHHGLSAQAINDGDITGELGEIILGRKAGRQNDRQITVADLTGIGAQDAACATLVYEKALRAGLGEVIQI